MFVSAAPSYSTNDGSSMSRRSETHISHLLCLVAILINVRRPSFPQPGYDSSSHKTLHEAILQQRRSKILSINLLSESEDINAEGESDEIVENHGHSQCSCFSTKESCTNNNSEKSHVCNSRYTRSEGGRQRKRKYRMRRKYLQGTVVINVGGQIFETYRSTLVRLRTPIFHAKESLKLFYRKSKGDYFFDRDPTAFASILNFLRTGELHIPTNMCGPSLQNEFDFWGIEEQDIARCCWTQYNTWKTQCRSLQKLEHDRKFSTTQEVYAWVSIIFVFISIFSFCAETHPTFRVHPRDVIEFKSFYNIFSLKTIQWSKFVPSRSQNLTVHKDNIQSSSTNYPNITASCINISNHRSTRIITKRSINRNDYNTRSLSNSNEVRTINANLAIDDIPHPAILIMDLICLIFFTLEYVTRFLCSPSKVNFLRGFQNVVDFLAIAPDYVELFFILTGQKEGLAIMDMLFILRILRLFRIFRLIRHVPGLWILLYTLRASFNELMLMSVFLLIGMVVFATLVHFVEPDGIFSNIPVGFWWSVVTMTTVGYGDMYPQSAAGFFIGSCCAIAGLLMIAFTVPIIVSNFVLYYTHVQYGLVRRDREIERMKEEEESVMHKSRSSMDIEMMGSVASVSPTSVFSQKNIRTRRDRSFMCVHNVIDSEDTPKAKDSLTRKSS